MRRAILNRPLTALIGTVLAAGSGAMGDPAVAGQSSGGMFVLSGTSAAGGTSTGNIYSVTGWVAPSGAGTSSGEGLDVTCGFLGVYTAEGGEVTLKVGMTEDGKVRLWWPADIVGYELEFTTQLGPGMVWQNVTPAPADNSWITEFLHPSAYFRLRKP